MTDKQLIRMIQTDRTIAVLAALGRLDWTLTNQIEELDHDPTKNLLEAIRRNAIKNATIEENIAHHKRNIERVEKTMQDVADIKGMPISEIRLLDADSKAGKVILAAIQALLRSDEAKLVRGIPWGNKTPEEATTGATCNTPLPPLDPFISCDGKPYSTLYLQAKLDEFIAEEKYELAADYRDEIERRGLATIAKNSKTDK